MPSPGSKVRVAAIFACGISVVAASGCTHQSVRAASPVATVPEPTPEPVEKPMNVAPDTSAMPPGDSVATPPAVAAGSANPPEVALPKAKTAPAPPRPSGGQSATEVAADDTSHPAPPQISPQLSASDQEMYKRKTEEDAGVAQQNLRQATGKQLSAAQKDLMEKISGFLAQSQDAGKTGDWARAQNLAQKARLLSLELINSL